jgi:general secretion pathway protein G
MKVQMEKGFTLIELLIVVAIVGIVAAIALPNLLVALQKSKQKSTMADISSICKAVESYMVDHGIAPNCPGEVSNLDNKWFIPFYIKKIPHIDSWGTAIQYEVTRDLYTITSFGRDRAPGPEPADPFFTVKIVTDFDYDLMLSNGTFTQCPRSLMK